MLISFLCLLLCLVGAQQITPLVAGTPVHGSAVRGAFNYYSVDVTGRNQTLTITVTTTSGDPDLYADLTNQYPNSTTAQWSARAYGNDAISLNPSQYNNGNGTVWISVYGWSTSEYTIVANFEGVIILTEEQPQAGSVPREGLDLFVLYISNVSHHSEVIFTATPISGMLSLYISVTGYPVPATQSSYQWTSPPDYSGQPVVIRSTDVNWPSSTGIFYVGVYGVSDATYSLVAGGNQNNTILRDEIPVQGQLNTGQWGYYQIDVTDSNCTLRVTLTSFSGDPDLYMSRYNQFPNSTNSERQSLAYGSDEIFWNPAPAATYYIGVYGWRNTSFSLVGDVACDGTSSYLVLVDGVPQLGHLETGQERLYRFSVTSNHKDITFAVTRQYGDPDLYVNTCAPPYNNCTAPSPTSFVWRANSNGEDTLTIFEGDRNYCGLCDYIVGVYAAANTSYSLTGTTANHLQRLQAGVPVVQVVQAGEYEYFQIDLTSQTDELTITVSPIGYGDPDLYASATNHFPNSTSYTWVARRFSTDSITIPYTDANACGICSYYISVYGWTNVTFTLVANFGNVTQLQDGIVQTGAVTVEEFKYYDIQVSGDYNDITITVSSIGDVSLFITAGDRATTPLPQVTVYNWTLVYYQSVKQIIIPSSAPAACHVAGCVFRIGVWGASNATFNLLAATSGVGAPCIPLTSGAAQLQHVDAQEYQYFCIPVLSSNQDLSIIVTPISGDPDLYVSQTSQRPNSTNYEKSASRYGADTVDYLNATTGMYYIGVYAFTNTTFNILAQILAEGDPTSNLIQLYNGQPQQGSIFNHNWLYYQFTIPQSVASISFSTTVTYGNPNLYVNFDNSTNGTNFPNTTNYNWQSTTTQNDAITINNPTSGRYIIGVYAYTTCGYAITATIDGVGLITLQNGVNVRGTLSARQYAYYVLPVDSSDKDFTVTVTPFTGDPDLYVSTVNQHPNTTNYMWKAEAYRTDSITVGINDPNFCRCNYYIAVYAFSATQYSITAWYASIQELQDGIPVLGVVQLHAWVYYMIRFNQVTIPITFSMTPQNGNPDIYISTRGEPNMTNYMWRATDTSTTSTIVVQSNDPSYCSNNCTYFIGIYGVTGANYTLSASTTSNTIQLRNGVPSTTTLNVGNWQYYSYQVVTGGLDLYFTTTPVTGDPDMYISHLTQRPNTTSYEYAAFASGADTIVISASPATTWYIGIYAFTNTTYTITGFEQTSNRTAMQLVNGVPQSAYLAARLYNYYAFTLGSTADRLTITVSRIVGDPDLYIRNDGQFPTTTSYQWASVAYGSDSVVISPAPPAQYMIGVYAFTTCNYTIKAETDEALTTLVDGTAFTYYLPTGAYKYFRFPVDSSNKDLTFTVTGLNGDPDLFVSDDDANQRPNSTHYTYAATAYRGDSISIPHSMVHVGTYYVSVYAAQNCTFTLIATLTHTPTLQDGTPQVGTVPVEASNYYLFSVLSGHTDLTVTVTPLSGSVNLYISNTGPPIARNTSTYQWSGTSPTAGQTIIIRSNDAHWCAGCTYQIMVYGRRASNYTVVATSSVAIQDLQTGVPRSSWVDTNQYQYFRFTLDLAQADLTIVVTPLSGDPDVYVSTINPTPTTTNYTWRAIAYGADVLDIDYTDPNYVRGVYYIGVYGYRNTTFTIVVTVTDLSNSNSSGLYYVLVDGVPQVGFLPNPGDFAYYELHIGDSQGDVTFSVTPRYGDPNLYIRNDGNYPNTTYWQWSSVGYGRDSITIRNDCSSCSYIAMVKATTHTLYSIVASTTDQVQQLESGIPVLVSLSAGSWSYFSISVDHTGDPLIISATAVSGDPDIYVSSFTTYPNETNFQFQAVRYGSDQIVINNPNMTTYYIGTFAYTNTSFNMLATNGPILLVNGEPHDDSLYYGQSRVYSSQVQNPDNKDLFITLSVNLGAPVIYVATWDDGTYPSATNYTWTTADPTHTTQRNALTIPMSDSQACANCTYFITVACAQGEQNNLCNYAITVDYDGLVLLTNGKPFASEVPRHTYKYFRAIVDTSTDLSIAATTFEGNIDIYVSNKDPYPSQQAYYWSSAGQNSMGGDHITISHTDPHFATGPFYISVYGQEDSRFSLTFATGLNLLSAGVPQVAAISSSGSTYFVFNTNNQSSPITLYLYNPTELSCDYVGTEVYNVYVSINDSNINPGADQYDYHFEVSEGKSLALLKEQYLPYTAYYVGIYGTANHQFSLQLSIEGTPDVLLSQRCLSGEVELGEWKYYEIYVTQAVNFVVLVESCIGNVDVYASQKEYQPTQTQYMWKSTATTTNDYIDVADKSINNSDFYIGVYGRQNTSYRITAWTATTPPLGPTVVQDQITVEPSWDSVVLYFIAASSYRYPAENITYTAYWAPQESPAVMYSLCGLQHAEKTDGPFISAYNGVQRYVSIKGLQSKKYYKFNVVATDPSGNTLIYSQALGIETLSEQSSSGISTGVVVGVSVPVILIVIVVIIYLVQKNRKLTRELDIEMQDVPKSAVIKAVRGPPSTREGKKYSQLLEREGVASDEGEGGDTGEAPDVSGGMSVS